MDRTLIVGFVSVFLSMRTRTDGLFSRDIVENILLSLALDDKPITFIECAS